MSRHVSVRLEEEGFERLERQRRRSGEGRSELIKRLLEEGLRMEEHPGIVFRDGPAGRRAGLSRGPDVWEVISVHRDVGARGDDAVLATAQLTDLSEHLVRAAIGYYAGHRSEIDDWIERNRGEAELAEVAWRRERQLLA